MGKFSGPNRIKRVVKIDKKEYALGFEGTSNDYGGVDLYSAKEITPEPDPYYKLDFTREDIKKEKKPSKNLYYFLIGSLNNHGEEREIFIENFMTDKFLGQFKKKTPLQLNNISILGTSDVRVVEDFYGIKADCFGNKYALVSITNYYPEDSENELFLASLHPKEIIPVEVKKALEKTKEYHNHEIFEKDIMR